MQAFKKYHAPLFLILLIMGAVVTWGLFLLNPQGAEVKETADPGYVPGPPQNLQATAITQKEIDLVWQAPYIDELQQAAPDQYVIYRSLSGTDFATIAPLATIPASVVNYEDTTLEAGTTYYYKVAASNNTGEGANSNLASATTLPPFIPSPLNVTAEPKSDQEINLQWVISPGSDATSYEIYRRKNGESNFDLVATLPIASQFLDNNLSSETKYSYYIMARSGSFFSDPSNTAETSTFASPPPSSPPPSSPPLINIIPPIISNIQIVPEKDAAHILWKTNKPAKSELRYGTTSNYNQSQNNNNYQLDHEAAIYSLSPNTLYHFQIIVIDETGAAATSIDTTFLTLKKEFPVPNVSNLQITTSSNALILNWSNPPILENPNFKGVIIMRKIMSAPKNTNDGTAVFKGGEEIFVDKTVLLDTDYFYTVFSYDSMENYSSGTSVSGRISSLIKIPETCDQQAVDCNKAACKKLAVCKKLPTTVPSTTPIRAPINQKLSLLDFTFLAGNNELVLIPVNGVLAGLNHQTIRITLDPKKIPYRLEGIDFRMGKGADPQLIYDKARGYYYNDVTLTDEGWYEAHLTVRYSNKTTQDIPFLIQSLLYGKVSDEKGALLPQSKVTLLDESGRPVDISHYGQANPLSTSATGVYGWMVPNGKYYLKIHKEGYKDFVTPVFEIHNNVVNSSLTIKKTTLSLPFISSATPFYRHPAWKSLLSDVVAPWTAGIAGISLLAQVSLWDLLTLLRLLFLQPILLIGSRKRQAWGQIYNSLNKLPVELAIVRLLNQENKIIQSMVTGRGGKYYFKIGPGEYRLEVTKDKMVFPSQLLKNYNNDGRKTDLYHGEIFAVKDQYPIITANIPGDPMVENKSLTRLRWERVGRILQFVFSVSGLGVTAYSIYLSPGLWYLWALLCVHVVVFFLFYRLSIPPRPKGWGIVSDSSSKKPISRSIVRLFNTQFNKLVATQATDHRGRYYFLAGDSEYQLSFEHREYDLKKSNVINLTGKEEENIAVNVGLSKKVS